MANLTNYLFSGVKNVGSCSCLHGTAYIDNNGDCRCADGIQTTVKQNYPIGNQNIGLQFKNWFNSLTDNTANASNEKPVDNSGVIDLSDNPLVSFVKANPIITLAAVSGAAYFLFFRESGFKSRESVTTTKW